jgi:oligoendopeptidase F
LLQTIAKKIREADSFVACLAAENQADKHAIVLAGHVKALSAAYSSALTRFDRQLTEIRDDVWETMLRSPELQSIAFPLEERRSMAAEKLPPEQEALANELAIDGYHGWGEAYNTTVSKFRVHFEENGKTLELSAGQAANKMNSPDRAVRQQLFRQWEEEWAKHADYCADALNHLAGFRLKLYACRGWEGVHKEPLAINRMSKETLDAMWGVIERGKDIFVQYLQRKAKLLGVERVSWYDVDAPVGQGSKQFSYDEGARLIIEQFRRFSPKLADFAVLALDRGGGPAGQKAGRVLHFISDCGRNAYLYDLRRYCVQRGDAGS